MKPFDHDPDDYDNDAVLGDDQLPADDGDDRETTAAVSGWGLSVALHAVVLLLLAFVVVAGRLIDEPVPLRTVTVDIPPPPADEEPLPVELVPQDITLVDDVVVEAPVVPDMDTVVEDVALTEDDVEEPTEAQGREEAVASKEAGGSGAFMAIGAAGAAAGPFGGRQAGARRMAVSTRGGSRASEAAVDRALRWFQRHQSINGMWDVDGYHLNCTMPGPKCEPGQAHTGADGDAAMTAYAILAYLGGGHDHRTPGVYRRTVKQGIDWLVANQLASGGWGQDRNYENGVAAMALAEAYAMTTDPSLREPAQRAIDHLRARQIDRDNGYGGLGWDYRSSQGRNDSSVSGWAIMALKSAVAGNLDVGEGMNGSIRYFERAWNATNNQGQGISDPYTHRSGFPYTWDSRSDATARPDRSAIGLCIGVFLGKGQGNLMLETLANDVMARALDEQHPDYQVAAWPVNTYYLYYNTLGIFQVGGERWLRWNAAVRDMLVGAQRVSDDCFDGSWDYEGTRFHGYRTGRLLSTAYAALSLQVYYRYEPIDPKRQVDVRRGGPQ